MTGEEVRLRTFYFVDEEPAGKPLDEYLLAFGPDNSGSGHVVVQCTEPCRIDENAILVILEEGDAVSVADGNLHQAVRCQLYSEEWLERVDDERLEGFRVIDVPPKLTGTDIPEIDRLNENQMAPFNLSINVAREDADDEGSDTIWKKAGKKSKELFF